MEFMVIHDLTTVSWEKFCPEAFLLLLLNAGWDKLLCCSSTCVPQESN